MRFTKIPLIATLMAVALSLLIVLPTLAQVSGDRTDGRLSVGDWLDVRIADNLDDLDNGRASPADDTPATIGGGGAWAVETSDGADDGFDARDTYFAGDLYVSNKEDAYNTILITAKVEGDTAGAGNLAPVDDTDAENGVEPCAAGVSAAVATVRNTRSNTSVKAYLWDSTTDDDGTNIYQGIVGVWDQEESIESQSGPCVAHTDPEAYAGSDEQSTEAQAEQEYIDLAIGTPASITTAEELAAAQAAFIADFVGADNTDGWTALSAAVIPRARRRHPRHHRQGRRGLHQRRRRRRHARHRVRLPRLRRHKGQSRQPPVHRQRRRLRSPLRPGVRRQRRRRPLPIQR